MHRKSKRPWSMSHAQHTIRWGFPLLLLLLLLITRPSAQAAVVLDPNPAVGNPPSVRHECKDPVVHQCVDKLNPLSIQMLDGPSDACMTAFRRDFPDWGVTFNWTQPWGGTVSITTYAAMDFSDALDRHDPGCIPMKYPDGTREGGMGAGLVAKFNPDDETKTKLHRFRWMQIIDTNDPLGGTTSPYVDPRPNDDDKPFYWKESEYVGGRTIYDFSDYPRRECPCLGHKYWRGELYLTDWVTVPGSPDDKYLFITQGLRWGFDIDCVPEPATLMMLALGVLAMRGRRRA